jgi:hypothetical protein
MMMRILRGAAVVVAAVGVIDPACDVRSQARPILSVEIIDTPSLSLPEPGGGTRHDTARRIRQALRTDLQSSWEVFDGPVSHAAARVVVADTSPAIDLRTLNDSRGPETPVHVVALGSTLTPNVRIVGMTGPRQITIWDGAAIHAAVEGRGLKGQKVVVGLFRDGVALTSTEHEWRADVEIFDARLTFLPPAVGAHRLEVRVSSAAPERTELDNRVSLLVDTNAIRRRVLVYQPRLSWMGTFVARAIERDPRLELVSRAQASRGIAVSAGRDTKGFDGFDAVVVGAPEALTVADVDALARYVTGRGGSVLILADRKPAGASLSIAPASLFDDVVLEKPVDLVSGLRASEMTVPHRPREGWETLASDRGRPVLMATLRGRGRLVFSGALDAWRYREGSRYWQDLVAELAARTPATVHVQVEPDVVRPGESVEVSSNVSVARIGGQTIRLWPGGEPGLFRGELRAPATTGVVTVTVKKGDAVAEASLSVDGAAARAWLDRDAGLAAYAAAHGGRVVRAQDIGPLVTDLQQSAERRPVSRTVRPMRHAWWIAPFVGLLAAEWTLRRRRHLH